MCQASPSRIAGSGTVRRHRATRIISGDCPTSILASTLEVSTHDDEIEGPLSWRDCEFQVKNPEGQLSNWITFTYPFDDAKLSEVMNQSAAEGRRRVAKGDNAGAVEPLRKAMVIADRMLGVNAPETSALRTEWNAALDNRTLDKLRFQVGTRVRVIAGEHTGKSGSHRHSRIAACEALLDKGRRRRRGCRV